MANKNDPQELDIDGPWPAEPEPRLVEFLAYWRSKHDANGDPTPAKRHQSGRYRPFVARNSDTGAANNAK